MTDSESGKATSEQYRRPSEVASNGSGIGSKLLLSPSFQAKDGVLAVQQGYGTIDGGVTSAISPLDADQKRQIKDVIFESRFERDSGILTSSPHRTPRGSKPSSLYSVEPRRTNSFRPGPARSGSITEQVIDVNGVRKVVLQTTSSSSSGDDESTNNDKTSPTSQHPSPQETARVIYEQAIESEHDGGSISTSKKKRRRRKKKKKQGDEEDPENAHLLPK
jgi:metal transporter CNNM